MRSLLAILLACCVLASAIAGWSVYRNRSAQADLILPRAMSAEEEKVVDVVRLYAHCLLVHDLAGLEQVAAPDYKEPHGVSGRLHQIRPRGVHAIVLEWAVPGDVCLDRAGFRQSYEYFYQAFPEVSGVHMNITRIDVRGDVADLDVALRVKGRSLLDGVALRPFENHAHFLLRMRREQARWYLLERRILGLQTWLM